MGVGAAWKRQRDAERANGGLWSGRRRRGVQAGNEGRLRGRLATHRGSPAIQADAGGAPGEVGRLRRWVRSVVGAPSPPRSLFMASGRALNPDQARDGYPGKRTEWGTATRWHSVIPESTKSMYRRVRFARDPCIPPRAIHAESICTATCDPRVIHVYRPVRVPENGTP